MYLYFLKLDLIASLTPRFLHSFSQIARQSAIDKEHARLSAAGQLPKDVAALLGKDHPTGFTPSQ